MDNIKTVDLVAMFQKVSDSFMKNKERLTSLDAEMGDGDLGITMTKGFGALPQLIDENMVESDVGKTLSKAGMKMSSVVPSTMGTLMSSGLMEAGKSLKGKESIGPDELILFFQGFAAGIKKRGKCEVGDRTVYDALFPAAEKASQARGSGIEEISLAAFNGAEEGVEATKSMIPKFGKAAVFTDRALGKPDQGAIAGYYLIEGINNYIQEISNQK